MNFGGGRKSDFLPVSSKKQPPTQIPQSPMVPAKKDKAAGDGHTAKKQKVGDKEYVEDKNPNIRSFMKPRGAITTVDLTVEPKVTLTIRDVAHGYVSLVSINKTDGGKLCEINHVIEAVKGTTIVEREFMLKNGMIAVAQRRKTKRFNEPIILQCPLLKKNYEDKYFVIVMEDHMTKESVLFAFQKMGFDVGIKSPYDWTSEKKQALDHYLLDNTIIKILRMTWSSPVDENFYETNTVSVTQSFFSHPYPYVATRELGYPNKEEYS